MATLCPKCKKENVKKNDNSVYCAGYKPKKNEDGSWSNEGSCDFRVSLSNKVWKTKLTPADVKKLIDGETLTNKKGDKMILDLTNQFFTKITFAPKVEDEDL